MKFMGKWIIWSHAANGYVVPGQPMGPPTMLYANSSAHIDEAVYNLYAGPNEGELIIQANSLAASSGSWIQCDSAANPVESMIPTANPLSASPVTTQQNGNWSNLLYGSTLLYVNPFFSIWLYEMMLGNPSNDGDPNLTITIKTQSLDTYKKSGTATGVDFSNIDFTGADLIGIDFTNANFTGAKMNRQTELPPATVLRAATFTNAHLNGVGFGGCDLTGADFTGASLAGALFDSMTLLAGAKFVNVDLSGLDFAGVDLSGADFTGAIVNGLNLQGATLSGAIMPGLDLTKLDSRSYTDPPTMSGNSNQLTVLTGSKIPLALLNNNWQWTDLRNATIPDLPPSITQLKASGAKLSGLNRNVLTGISLERAVLDNTLMDGLGLSGA